MLLASVLTVNTWLQVFVGQVASASGDQWKAHFSSLSWVSGFAMSESSFELSVAGTQTKEASQLLFVFWQWPLLCSLCSSGPIITPGSKVCPHVILEHLTFSGFSLKWAPGTSI
jgi:hypothetical protein